jgi:hypothetical protein
VTAPADTAARIRLALEALGRDDRDGATRMLRLVLADLEAEAAEEAAIVSRILDDIAAEEAARDFAGDKPGGCSGTSGMYANWRDGCPGRSPRPPGGAE